MTDAKTAPVRDYSETLFLPKTDFAMRAELPKREPGLLERWARMGLYQRLRQAGKGRAKFVLPRGGLRRGQNWPSFTTFDARRRPILRLAASQPQMRLPPDRAAVSSPSVSEARGSSANIELAATPMTGSSPGRTPSRRVLKTRKENIIL